MSDVWMILLIIAIVVALIVFFYNAIKHKKRYFWILIFTLEVLSLGLSVISMFYFDSLPGYGMMPGFTYLGEVLVSLLGILLFSISLPISIIIAITVHIKNKNKKTLQ